MYGLFFDRFGSTFFGLSSEAECQYGSSKVYKLKISYNIRIQNLFYVKIGKKCYKNDKEKFKTSRIKSVLNFLINIGLLQRIRYVCKIYMDRLHSYIFLIDGQELR